MHLKAGEKIFNIMNMTAFALFSLLCLFPFINILSISLNDGMDSMKGGIYFLPRKFTWINYGTILTDSRIVSSFIISISRTILGVVLAVLANSMFAFALSKKGLPGRKIINWYVFIPMFFSGGLIPYYLICKSLGLTNTFWVFVIPWIMSPFYILMMRVYYLGMPDSLEESAKIEGAGYWRIFFKIYFPLSLPSLATIALLAGLTQWNDWYDGTVMVHTSSLWPMQTLLLHITTGADITAFFKMQNIDSGTILNRKIRITPDSIKSAMLIVTIVPIVMIYPFLQKYFIKGMMIGSIKG
jgi:putative aldouronate transport system permease protein